MEIRKKCWPEMFENISRGKKKFDLRLGDSSVKEGDILVLEEFNPETKAYTGRILKKKISYVLRTKDLNFWKKEDIDKKGFVVMSLE